MSTFKDVTLHFRNYASPADTSIKGIHAGEVALDPADLAATTSVEETITIVGVQVGDFVLFQPPASLANDLTVMTVGRVSADNTVKLRLSNIDNTNAINDTERTWKYLWFDLT
jgi:hypothetical protein